jgi:hypothetical protein
MDRCVFVPPAAALAVVGMLCMSAPAKAAGPYLYVNSGIGIYTLQRANLDGSGVQTISTHAGSAFSIDDVNGKIYYGQESPTIDIVRADLDGSNPSTYVAGWRPDSIDIDGAHNRAFFSGGHVVYTTSLTNPGTPAAMNLGLNTIVDIDYDPATDTVLAANNLSTVGANQVWRITPGVQMPVKVVDNLTDIRGLALDADARDVYFSAVQTWPQPRKIYRADADDGSGVELISDMSGVSQFTSPTDVEVVP